MKPYLIIISLLIFNISCKKDNSQTTEKPIDDFKLDTFVINNYLIDAKNIYYKEVLANTNHPNYNNVIIDSTEVLNVLKMIQAVYNLKSPQTDSIFKGLKIHNYETSNFSTLVLTVKTELPEINKLSKGIIPTGAANLDTVLNNFPLLSAAPNFLTSYPKLPYIKVITKLNYNLIPIKKQYKLLPQIIDVDITNWQAGEGSEIKLIRNIDHNVLFFSYRTGDCPSGCLYSYNFQFKIKDDKATFISSGGYIEKY